MAQTGSGPGEGIAEAAETIQQRGQRTPSGPGNGQRPRDSYRLVGEALRFVMARAARLNLPPREARVLHAVLHEVTSYSRVRDYVSVAAITELTDLDRRRVRSILSRLSARGLIVYVPRGSPKGGPRTPSILGLPIPDWAPGPAPGQHHLQDGVPGADSGAQSPAVTGRQFRPGPGASSGTGPGASSGAPSEKASEKASEARTRAHAPEGVRDAPCDNDAADETVVPSEVARQIMRWALDGAHAEISIPKDGDGWIVHGTRLRTTYDAAVALGLLPTPPPAAASNGEAARCTHPTDRNYVPF